MAAFNISTRLCPQAILSQELLERALSVFCILSDILLPAPDEIKKQKQKNTIKLVNKSDDNIISYFKTLKVQHNTFKVCPRKRHTRTQAN